MRIIEKMWAEIEHLVESKGLPERTIAAVSDAAMGFHVRSIHYRNAADVSNVVASRDLNALVKAGIFVSKGEKRVYSASADLRNIYLRLRAQEPKEIGDPFASDAELLAV
jgi:hypothetical protein